MDQRTALKAAVLAKLASAGIPPSEAAAYVRRLREGVEKRAWVWPALAAVGLAGNAVATGTKNVADGLGTALNASIVPAGVGLGLAAGGGAYLGHQLAAGSEPDINLDDLKREELVRAYQHETARAKSNTAQYKRMQRPVKTRPTF